MKNKKIRKIIKYILIFSTLISILSINTYAFATYDFLHVPRIKQTYSNTSCWAAAGASVATYLGKSTTESQFARAANYPLTEMATMATIMNGFTSLGIAYSSHGRLNFVDYQDQIYYIKKPVYIQLYSHAVVGDGYRTYNGRDEVLIMDPATGATSYYNYSDLSSGEYYYWWIGSLKY